MDKGRVEFSIESVKQEVINTSILVATFLGILSFGYGFFSRLFQTGLNISLVTETITILLLILIAIKRKKLSLSIKVYALLALIFFLVLSDSLIYGVFAGARIYLALVPVFSLVYFSLRRSFIISLLAIAAFLLIGYLHHAQVVSLPAGYEPQQYVLRYFPWVNNAIHIALLGLVVLYITRKFFLAFTVALEDLKERNKLISESERNYREIFNSTNESIFIHDYQSTLILDANDAALRMYGFDHKDEIVNFPVTKISAPTGPFVEEKAKEVIRKAITEGPQVFEWRSKRKNGEEFFSEVSLRSTNIGGEGRVLAVLRDITDRKQSEQALRMSEEKLSTIFRFTPIAIAIADVENEYRITDVNEAFAKATGYQYQELIGHTHQERMLWAYPDEFEKATVKFREAGRLDDFEFHFRRKDGEIRNGRISTEPAMIAGRKSLVTATVDITFQKKVERQLIAAREASENKGANLRSIIENTTDSIWAFDKDYKIIYTNNIFRESFKAIFGVNLFPGTSLLESLPESIRPIWKKRYDLAMANNRILFEENIESENINTYIQVSMNPILADGKVIGVSCFGNDITKRKKTEEAVRQSEEKFRIIFEKSPLGIFRFNQQGIIYECNNSLTSIIGSPREKVIGKNLFEHPDEKLQETLKKVAAGDSAVYEGPYTSIFTGKITPVRFFFAPIINKKGKPDGGICMAEDLTSHQQREEFKKQVEIARESVRFKQSFLANMSHEIRTPLTGVLGMIEVLENTHLSNKQQDYINTLKLSGENLKEIINQVLDYSKIEAGKLKLKKSVFAVKSLLHGAETLYQNIAKKGVKFCSHIDNNIPGYIKADKGRISQVINNLVSNALKFTEQGTVMINATLEEADTSNNEGMIRIEIKDTGIGIPESMQKKLFNPFSQIDSNDTIYREGSGLGLSICKELVNLHGGQIGVSSKPGKGSLFWFTFKATLPLEDEIAGLTASEKPEQKERLRILLVEDKKINQKVISILLNNLGHEVSIAEDGLVALERYRPGFFDLILMDIQMPRMDGITATRQLREKHTELPPIVGLSANAFEGDREKYMSQGLDEYLTKPVKKDDFVKLISKIYQ